MYSNNLLLQIVSLIERIKFDICFLFLCLFPFCPIPTRTFSFLHTSSLYIYFTSLNIFLIPNLKISRKQDPDPSSPRTKRHTMPSMPKRPHLYPKIFLHLLPAQQRPYRYIYALHLLSAPLQPRQAPRP